MTSQPFSQHARLIRIETAQGSGLPESLVAESFTGFEAVNALFHFEIDALSLSTDVDLKLFIGEQITLRLLLADGSLRAWHGYCTEAAWLGADGGLARYRLRLEPFLAFLTLRRDARIFQDQDLRGILTTVLKDYPQANFAWDVTQTLAQRDICCQYRESDFDFLVRLLASEGLNWRFEHDQTPDAGGEDQGHARHKLILFDAQAPLPAMPGNPVLRFHGVRAGEADDSIQYFSASRQVQSSAVAISSWDPYQLVAPATETASALDVGDTPQLAVYDGSLERRFADPAVAGRHAELRLKALELGNKAFEGRSAVRQLNPGHGFELSQHERYAEDNQFTVVSVSHQATNNLDAGMARLSLANPLERGTYRNQFTAVRQAVALVPTLTAQPAAPTALGPQTALVVGLEEAPLTTDRDHRIKIQFPWQRGQNPNPGGFTDSRSSANPDGNAPGNDRSGTWVRVAEAVAGPNWGSTFTPRIGSEVLVDFIDNDIDRPVIVACLFNGNDLPPFAAGVDSGRNHAGVISGIHSHNLDAGGYNQWVVDDTTNQLRMRLASSTAASQLNLGHLIHQSPHSAQRGHYRGHGFELRTDAWGVIRGEQGVFISTQARNHQGSGVQSTPLDSAESVAQLNAAQTLTDTLTQAATHHTALISAQAAQAQQQRLQAIAPQQHGHYPGDINGQPALKAHNAGRELDNGQPVERFQHPFIHLDSAASMAWATPNSTTVFAGGHLNWTTQADSHWAAANTAASVSAHATTLFTHQGGIQAIAADGPVSLQAHTGPLDILADQALTVTSVNGRIEIKAKDTITLQAGQTAITLDGGNITFTCPGQFTVHASRHPFEGGSRQAVGLNALPQGTLAEAPNWLELRHTYEDLEPVQGATYKVTFNDGSVRQGQLDGSGFARLEGIKAGIAAVEYGEDSRPWQPSAERKNPDYGTGNADVAALYQKYLGETA